MFNRIKAWNARRREWRERQRDLHECLNQLQGPLAEVRQCLKQQGKMSLDASVNGFRITLNPPMRWWQRVALRIPTWRFLMHA